MSLRGGFHCSRAYLASVCVEDSIAAEHTWPQRRLKRWYHYLLPWRTAASGGACTIPCCPFNNTRCDAEAPFEAESLMTALACLSRGRLGSIRSAQKPLPERPQQRLGSAHWPKVVHKFLEIVDVVLQKVQQNTRTCVVMCVPVRELIPWQLTTRSNTAWHKNCLVVSRWTWRIGGR